MISKYFLIILFIFPLINSLKDNEDIPSHELEIDNSQSFSINNMTNNELYISSKNTLSGVLTYDIDSPVPLILSSGTSNSKDTLPSSFVEGHKENVTDWKTDKGYKYFFSVSVLISDDDTYTFLKIKCEDNNDCIKPGENIDVKVIGNYTWKIAVFFLIFFIVLLGIIFSTCFFARNCITKCCNFSGNQ